VEVELDSERIYGGKKKNLCSRLGSINLELSVGNYSWHSTCGMLRASPNVLISEGVAERESVTSRVDII
jgi:hypothetical protein